MLVSVVCKKYTNTNGKDSKYTNTINISIIWSCGGGGGRQCKITCREGVRNVEEGVEGVDPSVGEEVGSSLSSSIISLSLYMLFFASFLSFRVFCNLFWCFFHVYFKQKWKRLTKNKL